MEKLCVPAFVRAGKLSLAANGCGNSGAPGGGYADRREK
jgi:hypothetical protein